MGSRHHDRAAQYVVPPAFQRRLDAGPLSRLQARGCRRPQRPRRTEGLDQPPGRRRPDRLSRREAGNPPRVCDRARPARHRLAHGCGLRQGNGGAGRQDGVVFSPLPACGERLSEARVRGPLSESELRQYILSPAERPPHPSLSRKRGEGVASGAVVHYAASSAQSRPGQMKPAPFDYHAPRQLKEAAELLATLPNAKILAGGQSLVPMMNFRYVVADHLVDLGGIADLRGITVVDGWLRIGAMMRQRELETAPEVAQYCPLLADALRHVGHRQTRNRGTIGGSRQVAFADFSTGFMATALEPDEMIAAIDLPVWRQGHGYGFHEFARRHGDFALAGAAALLDVGSGDVVRRAALSLCGVAAAPVRVEAAEARLVGQPLDSSLIRSAAAATWLIEPISDIHAGAEYRRHLAQVLSARALTDAARRAGVDVPNVV